MRTSRTVALRRALLGMLFLGGFLVLAAVFGGSAHAAEQGGLGDADEQRPGASRLFDSGSADTMRERTEDGAQASATTVKTAGSTLRTAAQPVEEQTRKVAEPVVDVVRDTADTLPVRLPADGLDADTGAHTDAPEHGGQRQDDARAQQRDRASDGDRRPAADAAESLVWQASWARTDAPDSASHDSTRHHTAFAGAADSGLPGGAPTQGRLPQAPCGTASQISGDNSGSRGGDQHAALPPYDTTRFGLARGAVGAGSSAATRERYNEVLEFPG
ncbi:hypothetical protein [Streptomyces sp. XD-27]|uniref:hypothetical protein n=1 Tax=Streptomyces sp. XD-27 TaxID=3062779 RepID=UPI0026F45EB7|nr:hypothetical protein [Streptomyces sp. XD-27]WKX70886.1 hypothetical protein Q3Y56_14110 [Streptomyces sp. XD-27]